MQVATKLLPMWTSKAAKASIPPPSCPPTISPPRIARAAGRAETAWCSLSRENRKRSLEPWALPQQWAANTRTSSRTLSRQPRTNINNGWTLARSSASSPSRRCNWIQVTWLRARTASRTMATRTRRRSRVMPRKRSATSGTAVVDKISIGISTARRSKASAC